MKGIGLWYFVTAQLPLFRSKRAQDHAPLQHQPCLHSISRPPLRVSSEKLSFSNILNKQHCSASSNPTNQVPGQGFDVGPSGGHGRRLSSSSAVTAGDGARQVHRRDTRRLSLRLRLRSQREDRQRRRVGGGVLHDRAGLFNGARNEAGVGVVISAHAAVTGALEAVETACCLAVVADVAIGAGGAAAVFLRAASPGNGDAAVAAGLVAGANTIGLALKQARRGEVGQRWHGKKKDEELHGGGCSGVKG